MQNTLTRRHMVELIAAQLGYWVFVAVAVLASRAELDSSLKRLFAVLPILPGIAIILVGVRIAKRCDEYIRVKLLEAAAIVAAMTAAWTLIYSYLEIVGFPRLSMMWVGNIGWSVFIVFCVRLMLLGSHAK